MNYHALLLRELHLWQRSLCVVIMLAYALDFLRPRAVVILHGSAMMR